MKERLIIDARGTEKDVLPLHTKRDIIPPLAPNNPETPEDGSFLMEPAQIFPDKTVVVYSYEDAAQEVVRKQEYATKKEVSQNIGTWNFVGEYPNLPHAFTFMTDEHFGSTYVDQRLLDEHHRIIENTPNFGVLKGGDLIDNFSPIKHPSGMMSDAIPPDEQALAQLDKLMKLDKLNKLGAVQIGNHDDWLGLAGMRFQTFLRDLACPVYSGEGIININVGGKEKYVAYWSHHHWGASKLNVTNAAKRAIQFNAPNADLAMLGHTHQAAFEMFDLAGKTRGVIVGGTYKLHDTFGSKWGMGYPGLPGMTVIMWPDKHMFEIVRSPEIAQQFILGQIALSEK